MPSLTIPGTGGKVTETAVPQPDLATIAKQKTASGGTLTPAESNALLQSGATSSEINALRAQNGFADKAKADQVPKPVQMPKPASPLDAQGYSLASTADATPYDPSKALKDPALAARMRATAARLKTPSPFNLGKQLGDTPDTLDAVTGDPRPPVVAAPPPVVNIPSKPVQPIGGGPVTAAITAAVPGAEKKLSEPIPPAQAKQAMDAMAEYLKGNPNGLSLGNILDAVGVTLSARGGVQRKTRLQEANATQLQLAAQKSLAEQQQGYAKELKAQDLQNQIDLLPSEIEKLRAQGDVTRANELAALRAQKQNELDLIKPRMAAAIEQGRAILGNKQAQEFVAGGGSVNRAKSWTE